MYGRHNRCCSRRCRNRPAGWNRNTRARTNLVQVVVSGAAGFLGSHLADAFIRTGHEVTGCDNMIGGDLDNLPEGIRFEEADCCDVDAMKRLTAGTDLIYHCAAIATEGLSVFSPALIAKHVYENTAGILVGAASSRVKRFVFCSSMARYGQGKPPFREDQTPRPEDPYGIAKYAAELLVANVCDTHGMEYVIAVPHIIIGPDKETVSINELAGILADLLNFDLQPIYVTTRPREVKNATCSADKAR